MSENTFMIAANTPRRSMSFRTLSIALLTMALAGRMLPADEAVQTRARLSVRLNAEGEMARLDTGTASLVLPVHKVRPQND